MRTFGLIDWYLNISIAKKLYFTIGIMVVLVTTELMVLFFSLNTLSSVRAYVGGEGLWSKAQKDAVFHLYKYGVTGDEQDYVLFHEFMRVPAGDAVAREQLLAPSPDMEAARQGFVAGRNHPRDVDGMIDLFRDFHDVSYIARAIEIWGEAEPLALRLDRLAHELRGRPAGPSSETTTPILAEIVEINRKLTALEDDFSYTLGEGSRWMESLVVRLLLLTSLTVETTGILLAVSMSRGIQRGIASIVHAAKSLAGGRYETRARVYARDEIGNLAVSFNHMSDSLQSCIVSLEKARAMFQRLLECTPDAIVIMDEHGTVELVNAQTENLFGYTRDELIGRSVDCIVLPDDGDGRPLSRHLRAQDVRPAPTFVGRGRDGRTFPVELSLCPFDIEDGPRISAAVRDVSERAAMLAERDRGAAALKRSNDELVTRLDELAQANRRLVQEVGERKRAEAELRRAFAVLDRHVTNTPLAVIEWERASGGEPRVRRWSGRAHAIFGWTEPEVLGHTAGELRLVHGPSRPSGAGVRPEPGGDPTGRGTVELRCRTRNGEVVHCTWYNSSIAMEESDTVLVLSLVEDTTERVTALEDVYRLAHHDMLTGLPNRVLLQDRLGHALAEARRRGERVTVMMLDLDHFKNVNDALGHPVGDGLLQAVARRLGRLLRESDTFARVGGDEFVLVQTGPAAPGAGVTTAEKLLAALADAFEVAGNRLHVGASIGVTVFPDDASGADELLRNADMALYRAKHEGRGRYRFYSPDMNHELVTARSIEGGLRTAIDRGELGLVFQPTVALDDGRVTGLEALVRWPHPRGGQVAPSDFIPIAEGSGLIVPLGEWILRTACDRARAWQGDGKRLRVAVNVSAVQLRHRGFPEMVERALTDSGLAHDALELEMTETVFLDPSKVAITRTLHRVAELGVRLAIDDFGTGYSSLGYLKHFPFDRIKIDASFVRDIGRERETEAIVRAIIGLARSLGKAVTAEGVETEEQLAFLRASGCDEAQGFLLGRPEPHQGDQCPPAGAGRWHPAVQ